MTGAVVSSTVTVNVKVREFPEARQKMSGWLKHRIEDLVEAEGRK